MIDVDDLLGRMTLEEKVGQLFFLAFAGDRMDEAQVLFQRHFVSGSYLGNENLPTPGRAVELTARLQGYAASTRLAIPLLLGADQEGAWGVMVPGSTTGPGNMAIGATGRTGHAEAMYQVIGRELMAVGVNTLLAPCADCNTDPANAAIGVRSFGERSGRVAQMVEAAVRGASASGVIPTLKHFPGHGDTRMDSHRGLPTVGRAREELFAIDLQPFARGIAAGAPVVMTAHILFPALDPERPATLSRTILGDILRRELGFDGVVLSDSMNMLSMRRSYDPAWSAVEAIAAGVDLVMLAEEHYSHDAAAYLRQHVELIEAVTEAARDGRLPGTRLDEAVRRVLRLKSRLAAAPALDAAIVGRPEHRTLELQVARDALAVLRNADGLLPVGRYGSLVLVNTTTRDAYGVLGATRGIGPNQTAAAFDLFAAAVARRTPAVTILDAETVLAGRLPAPGSLVVAVTENHPLPGMDFDVRHRRDVLEALAAPPRSRLLVVGLRDPYELADLDFVRNYVCAFGSRRCSAEAAAELLFGEVRAAGTSPVTVPGAGIEAA